MPPQQIPEVSFGYSSQVADWKGLAPLGDILGTKSIALSHFQKSGNLEEDGSVGVGTKTY